MRVGWSRTEDVADCSIGAVCHLVRSGFLRQQHASGSHQTNHPSPPARERKMIRARRLQVLYCTGRTFICANSCMSCSYTPSPFSARHAEASSSCPSCPHIFEQGNRKNCRHFFEMSFHDTASSWKPIDTGGGGGPWSRVAERSAPALVPSRNVRGGVCDGDFVCTTDVGSAVVTDLF
jgi:hypothetical protein